MKVTVNKELAKNIVGQHVLTDRGIKQEDYREVVVEEQEDKYTVDIVLNSEFSHLQKYINETSEKRTLPCKRDLFYNETLHFKEGEYYTGTFLQNYPRDGVNAFTLEDKNGVSGFFYTGSDYFEIE